MITSEILDKVAICPTDSSQEEHFDSIPSFQTNSQVFINDWKDEEDKLAHVCVESSNRDVDALFSTVSPIASLLERSGNLRFWWYDAYENYDEGSIYLFGKVYDPSEGKYVSCCVLVENISRELYFLPRTHILNDIENGNRGGVELDDVHEEVIEILQQKGVENWTMTTCRRKYAFDLPNVPAEATYQMLNYSFKDYEIPNSINGETFSHVFGCNTGPLEHFIIKNNIMGPCWLYLKNASDIASNVSCCRFNVKISKPENCSVVNDEEGKPLSTTPPLTILSLDLQTKMNRETNANEIFVASMFYCEDVSIGEPNSFSSTQGSRCTIVRRFPGKEYPLDIQTSLKDENTKNKHAIALEVSESALLAALVAKFHTVDPDIVVGHNFSNVTLDILLHRMKEHDVKYWKKLGRMNITKWPTLQSGSGGSDVITFQERLFMTGRIVCDTSIALRDLVASNSYRLSELAASQLHIRREDIRADQLHEYFGQSAGIIKLAKHCSFDAFLSYALMMKLQILPLTKRLTNLSGNLWSRTMNGARSERNEYLLLHSFYNQKFVCPDKGNLSGKRGLEFVNEDLELEIHATKKRKDANGKTELSYSGGLVLEPKTGLYQEYVLLLDFNSLYPSIIREFNVCFTTMGGQPDYDGVLNTPRSQEPVGILPELVHTFIQQRQYIKSLLKKANLSETTKTHYNIEQIALKLTANSMYGCLGSSFSRFYARPLAAFITSKGRAILQDTADLAASYGLDVIYGDTDSVMINTKAVTVAKAKHIGQAFKHKVNEKYKLLEIEIDGFFRRTLLLRKKKYAALAIKEMPDGEGLEASYEVKGLDLVRRDWCYLSHRLSKDVLRYILSDKNRKDVVKQIRDYCDVAVQRIHSDSYYTIEDFIIRKQLTKSPELYENSRAHPHALVAKEMRRAGLAVNAGDTIPYVICKPKASECHSIHENNRPCMPDDVRNGEAKIDVNWYILNQILPPIARLCGPITELKFDMSLTHSNLDNEESVSVQNTETLESAKKDPDHDMFIDERQFSLLDKPAFQCRICFVTTEFEGPVKEIDGRLVCGLACKTCGTITKTDDTKAQVKMMVHNLIRKYYSSPMECNEPYCGYQTRGFKGDGRGCLRQNCPGELVRQFSEKKLYNQLRYYSRLFDIEAVHIADATSIMDAHKDTFIMIKDDIDCYLRTNDYGFINITDIMNDIF